MRIKYTFKKLQDAINAISIFYSIKSHDNWSREELQKFQHQQLSKLVRHAVARSPFYKKLYEQTDTQGEIQLEKLPVINKKTVMENFDQIVTDRRLKLADLNSYITQVQQDDYYFDEYRVLATSGSSGFKGVFVYSRKEWSYNLSRGLRSAQYARVSPRFPRIKMASVASGKAVHAGYRLPKSSDVGLYNIKYLQATERLDKLVKSLNAFKPEYLVAYSSIAALLAVEQIEGRLQIHPQVISTNSEICTPAMKQQIVEAWGVIPFESYSLTELLLAGCDCSFHQGIHIFEDICILEVVDRQNQPVPDGCMGDKILITNLFNYTQPLIRYEVTDMLALKKENCDCGRPFRLIGDISGRSDDIIYLSGLRDNRIPVHPFLFRTVIATTPEIKEFQIIHEEGLLSVRLMLRDGADEKEVAHQLEQKLKSGLESTGAFVPIIQIEFVKTIERDPNQMGKLKLIQSNVSKLQ